MRKRRKLPELSRVLEMPTEIYSGNPKITVIGFEKVMIENYKNILNYQDIFIRVNTHIGIINIHGYQLVLTQMTKDDIMITGNIESMDFEKNVQDA